MYTYKSSERRTDIIYNNGMTYEQKIVSALQELV